MGSWVIHKPNGTTRATVKRLEYHGKLMDERYLTVDVESPEQIGFSAGDYVIYRSEKFSIRNIADVEKCARPQSYGGAFVYKDIKLVSQGWQELTDTEMTDYAFGDNRLHYTGLGSFSFYMSKVSDMAYRVQEVLNNKYTVNNIHTWTVLIGGNTLPLSPSNENLDALDDAKAISISAGTTVKETLDLLWQNWGITYKVYSTYSSSEEMWFHYVDMRPVSEGSIPLEYGKGNGLRKVTRKLNPNVDICTRVRAYGSERNMPYRWYNTYNDVNEAMYIPQLMLPHAMAYYDSDGHYCDENGNLYTSLPENGGAANPWASANDVVLENVVKSAIYGKRDKEVHWNSDEMGEIFPSMKGMMYGEVAAVVDNYHAITYGDVNPDTTTGRLDQILDFEWASGDSGSSDPADLTTGHINFYVYIPNPGFNPISNNTSENVELLMQSGMCQSRGFIIITCEGLDSNRRASTDDGFSGTITQYKLTCAKITDGEIDQVFPNSTYDIEGGETFVFTGLEYNGNYFGDTWLSVYVAAAERRLLKAAAIWLRQHSTENFIYELELDNIYIRNHPDDVEAALREGAMIQIPDNEFGTTVYEIIDSLTITEGKEAIPTYEITLLRRDESESLGDRVKGLVGQTISASSEIAKANDSLARKVNVANLMELLTPLAADGTTAIAWNQATLQNTHYLRANVDFFGVSGVSALGRSSGGGGGGGSADLNALLDSINDSSIGNTLPTLSENGKCPVWVQTTENDGHWEWGTTGGEGGGVTLREPLSSINSASLGTPTESGQVITWNGSHWIYAIPQGGGGGDDDDTYLENITYWSDNENDSTYLENIVYWGNSEDDSSFLNNITYWGKSGGSTPSYSFDEAAMWAALGTNESTKIIDDSHISATIRNGAAAGATAIQQSDLNTALGSYYTKNEANGLFVHLTGNVNETITGVKTFSSDIVATRIKIGNAYISYNSNGLCIDDGNGGSMNLYATGGVSSLGVGSSGGGVSLNDPLDSINNDLDANPSGSNKILYYNGETWGYTDLPTGGSGEGISLNDVWTSLSAANSSNKIHNSHLPDTINVAAALHVNQYGYVENSNNVRFYLPNPQDTSVNYTLATTADIQNVDLTGYATESWVEGKNYLTGNQTITLSGDVSGSGTTTITTTIGTGKVTNDMLYGNIANNKLANSSITIGSTTVVLGDTISAATLLSDLQSTFDGRYVTKSTAQEITATKTFTAGLTTSNGISLNKSGQQWLNFSNGSKNFSFGQDTGGDCVLYADGSVNFYTNIGGNVGIGTSSPLYKFDVNGNIHTNSGYYLDSKLLADSNNGLNIGYGFASAATPLSTTIWGEGISFRSTDGTNNYTYGGCTKIDDTHGNITYGIMATDFIGVTDKFRFEYDSNNNTVWVLKANGQPVNFASLGGVTSLGVGASGTPNISSMNIATLTATTATAATLNVSTINPTSSEISILTPDQDGGYVTFNCEKNGEEYYFTDFYNVGLFGEDNNGETWSIEPDGSAVFASSNIGSLKVGSNGSYISRMYWDGTYLQVTVGGAIRYFKPETI